MGCGGGYGGAVPRKLSTEILLDPLGPDSADFLFLRTWGGVSMFLEAVTLALDRALGHRLYK